MPETYVRRTQVVVPTRKLITVPEFIIYRKSDGTRGQRSRHDPSIMMMMQCPNDTLNRIS